MSHPRVKLQQEDQTLAGLSQSGNNIKIHTNRSKNNFKSLLISAQNNADVWRKVVIGFEGECETYPDYDTVRLI